MSSILKNEVGSKVKKKRTSAQNKVRKTAKTERRNKFQLKPGA